MKFWPTSTAPGVEAAPEFVEPHVLLSRFIDDKRYLKAGQRFRAFLPDPVDNETSAFDVSSLSEFSIWQLGDEHVAPGRGRPIIGRADLSAGRASIKPLFVVRADRPPQPPRHVAIRGWPPWTEKERHKTLAMQLADAAAGVVR
jgi:hypothetical protein